jgi:DnaK suppressor protein
MATITNTAVRDPWPAASHADLRRLLTAQREVLREQRRSLRETMPWETLAVADEEERAAQEFEVGMDIALLEMRARQVQEMEAAVHLLESGEYGRCIDCGEAIQASRLRAHPFAVRCCTCQQTVEGQGQDAKTTTQTSRPFWEGPAPPVWPRSRANEGSPVVPKKRGPVAVAVNATLRSNGRSERKVNGWLAGP